MQAEDVLPRTGRGRQLPRNAQRTPPGADSGAEEGAPGVCTAQGCSRGHGSPAWAPCVTGTPHSQTQTPTSGRGDDRMCLCLSRCPQTTLHWPPGEEEQEGRTEGHPGPVPAHTLAYGCANHSRFIKTRERTGAAHVWPKSSRGLRLGSTLGTPCRPLQPRGPRRSTGRSESWSEPKQ